MTVMEAINRVDAVKPNAYKQQEKIRWLSILDGIIKKEIIDTHEFEAEFVDNEATGKLDLYIFDKLVDSFDVNAKGEYISVKTGLTYTDKTRLIEASCAFNGYTDRSLMEELLVPAPYDDIYIKWLEAQIDYANGEYNKYNNTSAAYNNAYVAYARAYHRDHMPKGGKEYKHF